MEQEQEQEPVEKTGEGDSLTGAYAVGLLRGMSQKEALKFACKESSMKDCQFGAGPSKPSLDEEGAVKGPREEDHKFPLEDHHFLSLIRHAERKDKCEERDEPYPNKFDPPLSR